jgi:hypothetical protein
MAKQYYSAGKTVAKGLAMAAPAEIGLVVLEVLGKLPDDYSALVDAWPIHVVAIAAGVGKALDNWRKHRDLPRVGGGGLKSLLGLMLCVALAMGGCATTTTTLPDGTVIEESRLDEAALLTWMPIILQVVQEYRDAQAAEDEARRARAEEQARQWRGIIMRVMEDPERWVDILGELNDVLSGGGDGG